MADKARLVFLGTALSVLVLCSCGFSQNREFTKIPAGNYPVNDSRTKVSVHEYLIAESQVTAGEYREFEKAESLDWQSKSAGLEDKQPMTRASWFEAIDFCNWLSLKEGLKPVYAVKKVTIERATLNNDYKMAVTVNPKADGFRIPTTAEFLSAKSLIKSGEFSSQYPEWCFDGWSDPYDSDGPKDSRNYVNRQYRGGSWDISPDLQTVEFKNFDFEVFKASILGFRLVKNN